MSKQHFVYKKNNRTFEITSYPGQELNRREYFELSKGISGYITPTATEKKNVTELVYHTAGTVTLLEFLEHTVLSKRLFAGILSDIITNIETADSRHFNRNLIRYSIDKVLVDCINNHIWFIYVPFQPYLSDGDVRELLNSILKHACFDQSEDISYVYEYADIINSDVNFSVYSLENFVRKLSGDYTGNPVTLCKNCHSKVEDSDAICPICGYVLREETVINNEEKPAVGMDDYIRYNSTSGRGQPPLRAWIEDESTGVSIEITKCVLSLGKLSEVVDYCVCNTAVSRKHAEIICENGFYYLVDLNSLNGTFLNGRRLRSGVKEPLSNNDKFVLANHNFIFHSI